MSHSPSITPFLDVTIARRTFYTLTPKLPTGVTDKTITDLANTCMLTVPSAFNNQSTRMVILLKAEHTKLWEVTGSALQNKIGEERYNASTKARIAGFSAAYGSILFWNDPGNVAALEKSSGLLYSDKAEEWTHQSNGMHQYFMWCALEALGLGVNLQHYNPLIDESVKETWSIPKHWDLKAQMVFGEKQEGTEAKEKEQKMAMGERLMIIGAEE